jgi:hypothetical protein
MVVPPSRASLMKTLWDFFGERLDARVVRMAGLMPAEQATTLAEVVMECRTAVNESGMRGSFEHATLNDDLLFSSDSWDRADLMETAKLVSLYTNHSLVATYLFSWADNALTDSSQIDTPSLQRELRELSLLQPLCEVGALSLVPPPSLFTVIRDQDRPGSFSADLIGSQHVPELILFDPLVSKRLIERYGDGIGPSVCPEDLAIVVGRILGRMWVGSGDDEGRLIPELVERSYYRRPSLRASFEDIARAARFYALQASTGASALTSDDFIDKHLAGIYEVLTGAGDVPDTLAGFSLPGTRDLTLDQVATLRKDAGVFEELRSGLHRIMVVANATSTDGSFRSFEAGVREAAADILMPVHERLTADLRRGRFAALAAEWGTRLAVSVSLGLAAHLGAPIPPLAGPASTAAGTLVAKQSQRGGEAKRIATRLTGLMIET